jgi:hypothetical protein
MSMMTQALRAAAGDQLVSEYIRKTYWSTHHKTQNSRAKSRQKAEAARAKMTDEQRLKADELVAMTRRR